MSTSAWYSGIYTYRTIHVMIRHVTTECQLQHIIVSYVQSVTVQTCGTRLRPPCKLGGGTSHRARGLILAQTNQRSDPHCQTHWFNDKPGLWSDNWLRLVPVLEQTVRLFLHSSLTCSLYTFSLQSHSVLIYIFQVMHTITSSFNYIIVSHPN